MRRVLEIFDLGKSREKNEERKKNFIELTGKYHAASIISKRRSSDSNITYVESSDVSKKKMHDEIMDIITKMSLSIGLNKDQRELTDYLAKNREEVERMIGAYFWAMTLPIPKITQNSKWLAEAKDYLLVLQGRKMTEFGLWYNGITHGWGSCNPGPTPGSPTICSQSNFSR